MAGVAIGLDIGRDVIRAVEVANPGRAKPTIVRYAEVPLPDGAVRSGEVREIDTVGSAIRKLWQTGGFKSKRVVLGMGNQRVLARELTVPRMPLNQIKESLPFQVQELLPVPVKEALLDFYPISESAGEHGPVVNGLLIAAIKDAVLANVNAVRKGGLEPAQVDLIPFALTRALTRGLYSRGTVALVDIGNSTTNVVVATNGVPQFVRMIPVGGDDVTRALVAQLEVGPQQAEMLKVQRGFYGPPTGNPADQRASEIIHATTMELLGNLRNTMNFYSNSHPTDPIQGVVISGGGSQLTGIGQALSELMRVPVVQADPFQGLEVARSARISQLQQYTLTVALGLAIGAAA
jgi:type IV pilus assembly protein PilM